MKYNCEIHRISRKTSPLTSRWPTSNTLNILHGDCGVPSTTVGISSSNNFERRAGSQEAAHAHLTPRLPVPHAQQQPTPNLMPSPGALYTTRKEGTADWAFIPASHPARAQASPREECPTTLSRPPRQQRGPRNHKPILDNLAHPIRRSGHTVRPLYKSCPGISISRVPLEYVSRMTPRHITDPAWRLNHVVQDRPLP